MLRGYPVLVGLTFGVSFFIVPSFMIFIRSTQPPEGSRARLYGGCPGIHMQRCWEPAIQGVRDVSALLMRLP